MGFLQGLLEVLRDIQRKGPNTRLALPDKLDLHFKFFRTGGYGIVDAQIGQIVRLG